MILCVASQLSGRNAVSLGRFWEYRCAMSSASCVGGVTVSQMCWQSFHSASSMRCGSVQASAPSPSVVRPRLRWKSARPAWMCLAT
eukprot:2593251-Prorocentrum_lima.AAC.1